MPISHCANPRISTVVVLLSRSTLTGLKTSCTVDMIDPLPIPETHELDPAIAWAVWDTAVRMQDLREAATESPAFAAHVARNAVPPWAVGARP